jgi:GntR family transcriptional regulator, arabinose operon transcriptional repressor
MPPSKSTQLASRIIRDHIDGAHLEPGDQLPSVRALQKYYGASITIVTHALSMLEAQGAIVRRHGKGCFVAEGREPSRTSNRATIAVVIPFISTLELMGRMLKGVEGVCRRKGHQLLVASTDNKYEVEQRQIKRLAETGCEGAVLYPVVRTRSQLRDDFLNNSFQSFPIVLLDMAQPEQRRPQVLFDNWRAGYNITRRLLKAGHERIAIMAYGLPEEELAHRSNADRYAGYEAAMADAGIGLRPEWCWRIQELGGADVAEQLRLYVRKWLEIDQAPTAVIAMEDWHAVTTVMIAREIDIAVPDELYVAGFDHLSIGQGISPPMLTTEGDFERAGEMAAEMVLQLDPAKATCQTTYVLPVPLVNEEHVVGTTPGAASKLPQISR